jgi:hypothetical protein
VLRRWAGGIGHLPADNEGDSKMEENGLKGSLAIVAVGVAIGLIGFAVEPLRFLLIISLLITVLGGGIAFYAAMQES